MKQRPVVVFTCVLILAVMALLLFQPQAPMERGNQAAAQPVRTEKQDDSLVPPPTPPEGGAEVTGEVPAAPVVATPAASPAGSNQPGFGVRDRYTKAILLAEREEKADFAGKPVIRRVRLMRDDTFKYPLLRVEDDYSEEPGPRTLVNQTAMVADHVMVTVQDPRTNGAALEAQLAALGATVRRKMPASGVWLVAYPDADIDTVTKVREALAKLPGLVRHTDPDFIAHASVLPNDTSMTDLWGMHNTGQSGGVADADIDGPEAWDMHTGSAAVKVGVIDTGIDHTHPDLAANMWTNPGEIAGNGMDDDGNGYIDDTRGWDFVNNDNVAMDDNRHGTHCAGTIGGAGNNGQGVAGVCWSVSLIPLKFLNAGGSGATSDAVEAVAYGNLIGLHLTSNSWGGGGYSQALKDQIDASHTRGILFVAAAGNSSSNNDVVENYPSNYDSPCIIAVASTTRTDERSSFSSYGLTTVELGAPGSDIYSTVPGGTYASLSGTSMATPHVSGACALLKAFKPTLTHMEIKEVIMASVDVTPAMTGVTVTGGRLNAHKALLMLDDLTVSPSVVVAAKGPVGGPFVPTLQTYTLTNGDATTPLNWTAAAGASWVTVSPATGTLAPGASASVSMTLNSAANALPAAVHAGSVIFTNTTSGVSFSRQVSLAVGQVDYFTELFTSNNDTDNQSWLFTPDGSGSFYSVRRTAGVTTFPSDPAGGTNLTLADDDTGIVTPAGGQTVRLYGTPYSSFFVGSNGRLMFGSSETLYTESLDNHFALPGVAALFDDLNPASGGGTVSWRQFADSVAVTYQNIPQFGGSDSNSFQIELFVDGRIRVTCLGIAATDGLIGLSRGTGVPADFVGSDFSAYLTTPPPPVLRLAVPATVTEGAGLLAGQGTVTLPAAAGADMMVNLASSNTSEVTVPATVTVPAGQTSATFDITVLDDAVQDGTSSVVISATLAGYVSAGGVVAVQDNEGSAVITLTTPASATEGVGSVQGTVALSFTPTVAVTVALSSSDPTAVRVPGGVVIPAGQSSATFAIQVVNDTKIDGTQNATITASMAGWTGDSKAIAVLDDENTTLAVSLPAALIEGDSTTGMVSISGTLPTALVVTPLSDTTSRLTVPALVTIPAGATSATFTLTAPNNALTDGSAAVEVSVSATGFTSASGSMAVLDNDLHHFTWDTIGATQTRGVPFTVTLTAKDVNDLTITSHTAAATLSAAGTTGILAVTPTTTGAFVSGVWTGTVSVNTFDPAAVLTATSSGRTGNSNAFNVTTGALAGFTWDTQPVRLRGESLPATVTARDAGGNTVPGFNGTASLSGYVPNPVHPGIVISELLPDTPDAVEFTNVGGAAVNIGGWTLHFYDFDTGGTTFKSITIPAGAVCAPGQVFRVTEYGTAPGTFPNFSAGVNLNWTAGPGSPIAVLVRDASGSIVDFMCADGLSAAAITSPVTIPAQQWSGAPIAPPSNFLHSYLRTGSTDTHTAANWTQNTSSLGTANSGLVLPFTDAVFPVSISPGVSGAFSAGVWSGNLTVLQTASQMRFRAENGASSGVSNPFDVTGALSLDLPPSAAEGSSPVTANLSVSHAPAGPLVFTVTSSDDTAATVPETVTLPGGQTSVTFPVTIVDDAAIDGPQVTTISVRLPGWTTATANLNVLDNETLSLALFLPGIIAEGTTASGTVSASGVVASDLVVSLSSDTISRLTVPATVTIAAGTSSATFTATAAENAVSDGQASVNVSAGASGYTGASATTVVADNDVHHFGIASVPSPQTRSVPFSVVITAYDVANAPLIGYNGAPALTAAGTGGGVVISPTNANGFVEGVWTAQVTAFNTDTQVVLTVNDGLGHTGASAPFDVVNPTSVLTVVEPVTPQTVLPGQSPRAQLVVGQDGALYGTTVSGGASNQGSIFKVTTAGVVTTLVNFHGYNGMAPNAGLVLGSDGNFYGTTLNGGASNLGTMFRMTPSGTLTTLASLTTTTGTAPRAPLVQALDGNFYGTTSGGGSSGNGTIFRMTSSGVITVLVNFTGTSGSFMGSSCQAGLVQASDGSFYGVTSTGGNAGGFGTVFKVTTGGTFTTLRSFSGTTGAVLGANPLAALMQAADGTLYGTTNAGGTGNVGTVFKITTAGAFTNLLSFTGSTGSFLGTNPQSALVQWATDGALYGMTVSGGTNSSGTLFKVTTAGVLTTLRSLSATADGSNPYGAFVPHSDGSFYAVCNAGGSSQSRGAVIKLTPSTGTPAFSRIYSFFISPQFYRNMILASDGSFYGGQANGAAGLGALVKGTTAGSVSQMAAFTSNNFSGPYVMEGADGDLYGTMPTESTHGQIFRMTKAGVKTTLVTLTGTSGANLGTTIIHGMIQASDGNFYGVTAGGGTGGGNGTVFKVTPAGVFTSLVSFTGTAGAAPGASPQTRLVESATGELWGTTNSGGAGAAGTVFKISKSGTFTNVVQFTGTTGAFPGSSPNSWLLLAGDGNFYGTTNSGGTGNFGTVYRVAPDGAFTSLVSFTNTGGAFLGNTPSSNLVQGSDGHLYGTTTTGGNGTGTVYRVALPSAEFASLVRFTGGTGAAPGSTPHATLRQAADGYFYGTTTGGGLYGIGTVFRVNPGGIFQSLYTFGTNNDGGSPNINGSNAHSEAFRLHIGTDGYVYGANASAIFRVHQQPAIQSVSASALASTSVTLTGTVLPHQDAASVSFQYGVTGAFGSQTPPQNIAAGTTPVALSAALAGLQPGTVYFWRMVTVTPQGAFYSSVQTFATPGAPLAITGSWLNAGQTSFSLDGIVNPLGSETTWFFEHGPTTAYGSQTPVVSAGSGVSNVPVGVVVSGLTPGTLYHVRLVASNATGTTLGPDLEVSTLPVSTATVQPQSQFANTGVTPVAGLYKAADGFLYGTTNSGGTYGTAGTVFRVSEKGAMTTVASFYGVGNGFNGGVGPQARLVQAGDGNFYATTNDGGTSNYGTIFRLTPAGQLTTLVAFNNASIPRGADSVSGLTVGPDGSLYGVTQNGGTGSSGTIFKVTTSGVLTTLVNFTGATGTLLGSSPRASLLLASDGNFYGTTATGGTAGLGTIFRLTPAGALTTLAQFTGISGAFPGSTPVASLVQGADGHLYGSTTLGGVNNLGTVFRITLAAGFTSLVSFNGTAGAPLGTGPKGGLVQLADGTFYGTTQTGGDNNLGTAFSLTPAGVLTTLVSFSGTTGGALGSTPQGDLVAGSDGALYGTCNAGGLNNNGTVFKLSTQGQLTTLVHLCAAPAFGRLAQGSDGKFYGATLGGGGSAGAGMLLSGAAGEAGGRVATLSPVSGTTALNARAGLLRGPDGHFYGTTVAGGALNSGSVFRLTQAGELATLITFTGTGGANLGSAPQAPLILGADGNYHGTTSTGGVGGFGTVFRMTPAGVQTTVLTFTGTTGAYLGSSPQAPLLLASDGNYYGTTTTGGSPNLGTVFRLTPAGVFTTLATFTGSLGTTLGSTPSGPLVQGGDGAIYGTTNVGGLSNLGTVFKLTLEGELTTLASFTGATGLQPGSTPVGGLQAAADGCFYGVTSGGGAYSQGTIFRVAPDGSVLTLHSFTGRQDGATPAQGLASAADGYLYGGNGTAFYRLRQPPVALTAPATLVTETAATLNGSVVGETYSGTVQFEYGPTPAYGSSTPAVNFGAGTAAETIFAPLEELQPYQTYHYRLVATTSAGVFASPNRTFTTATTATFDASDDVPVVSDGFNAGGQPLGISLAFAPAPGTLLTLVRNTGFAPVQGAFSGLPEGGIISASFAGQSYLFQITYTGGDGNDITLELVTQFINFPPIPAKKTTDGPFALAATASSGLPVTYEITAGFASATLSGSTVTLTGVAGTVTIRASQAGNGAAFGPANVVTQTFAVTSGAAFTQISGTKFSGSVMAIRSDGTLWGWGSASYGQLGRGDDDTEWTPVQVGSATNWVQVSCGGYHSVAVRANGTLWAAGDNTYGQLGDGTTTERSVFVQVGTASNWLMASAGAYHTLALKTDGTLWSWGYNNQGQLGQGTTGTSANTMPVQVGSVNTWTSLSVGAYFNLAQRQDGTLWAFGDNGYGQLGNGNTTDATSPVQITSMTGVTSFTAGYSSSAAVRPDGTLWTWGRNDQGQVGDGTLLNRSSPLQVGTATNWQKVQAGGDHVLAMRTGGTLWTWGRNLSGQLGQGYNQTSAAGNVPVQVGTSSDWQVMGAALSASMAVKTDGTLWTWGDNSYANLGYRGHLLKPVAAQFGPVADAAGGDGHGAILRPDGTLWTFGNNGNGQLGNGLSDSAQRPLPAQPQPGTQWLSMAAGNFHTAAIRADGTLWTWGYNGYGQVGDGTTNQRNSPGQVGTGTNWLKVGAGRYHTAALRGDGTLWAWGYNTDGQMGNGTAGGNQLLPGQVGTDSDWTDLVCGGYHLLARKQDGTLWAWGYNAYGQIGDGTTTNRSTPVKVGTATNWTKIVAGLIHTMAVNNAGALWAWGYNGTGVLGDGSFTNRQSPVPIAAGSSWKDVAAGTYHAVAVRSDRTLWVWGYNFYGQLGDGGSASRNTPFQLGTGDSWGRAFASNYSTLVSTEDGTLWSCGFGTRGGTGLAWRNPWIPGLVLPGLAPMQTVDFPAPASTDVGQTVILAATSSSGLPVSYLVDGPGSLQDNRVTVTGPGLITIHAWQPGDDYHQSSQVCVRHLNAPVPAVTTLAATAVGTTTATLQGTLNPNGTLTTARFQHGLTTAYGTDTAVPLAPANGSDAQNVSVILTGLQQGTTYHFRLSGTNAGGQADGADLIFSTVSTDATLAGLSVSPGAVYPAFVSTTINATAGVPNGAASFTVTAVATHPAATLTINGTPVASGASSGAISFPGSTATVNILVTAGDGVTTQPYTLAISRYVPFSDWTSSSGMSGGNTGAADDYDGDGVSNLLEYALGGSPTSPASSILPTSTSAKNATDGEHYLTINYRRRIVPGMLTYRLQRTNNLASWTDIPGLSLEQIGTPTPTGDGITEVVTFRVHPSMEDFGSKGFIRLRVSDN